jgi:hypothetical protein
MHHLRDCLRRESKALYETSLDNGDALLRKAIDGLEILLNRRVKTIRHGPTLP